MKAISKLQIETVEQVLTKALEKRVKTIADEAFKKDIAKYEKELNAFNKKAVELYNLAKEIKKSIEKNNKLKVDLDDYQSPTSKLPKTIEEAEESSIIKAKTNYAYNKGTTSTYEPNTDKEQKAIDDYILGLKLGTALMTDMQTLLDVIAKIK